MSQRDSEISSKLEAARRAVAARDLANAEALCREILQNCPEVAEAWNILGKMSLGQVDAAIDFFSTAVGLAPLNVEFRIDLCEALSSGGGVEVAAAEATRLLAIAPSNERGLAVAAGIADRCGDVEGALNLWERARACDPRSGRWLLEHGSILCRLGRQEEALPLLREASRKAPGSIEAWYQLGCALNAVRDFAGARNALNKAGRINSDQWPIWFEQAVAYAGAGLYDEALSWIDRVVVAQPQHGSAHQERARIQNFRRQWAEAVASSHRAIGLGVRSSQLQENLGYALVQLNRKGEAIRAFAGALLLDPHNANVISNLGAAALELGINTPALECFDMVLSQKPDFGPALINKGKLLKDRGRAREGVAVERQALGLDRGQPVDPRDSGWHNYLYGLLLVSELSPEAIAQEHRRWGEALVRTVPSPYKHAKAGKRAGRIRVGYMSPDLRQHSVTAFIEGLLRQHDRSQFEVFIYATGGISDAVTERLQGLGHTWRELGTRTDREIADRIHADRIDVLVELSGHTSMTRLGVCALRPAPVQVSYLGYPGTTGLPTIDYRLTDALADPLGKTEPLHSEKLLRIGECGWCYDAGPEIRSLRACPPSPESGRITFGCFNNIAKWNPGLVELWVEILRRVPGSVLYLKAKTLADPETREEWRQAFVDRGIDPERVILGSQQRSTGDHLAEYDKVDIALDTFPYHGTTTTCEALWAGVPVVTLAGEAHVSRVGVSLLTVVGLADLVAKSKEEFVRLAVELAGNGARLKALRQDLRPKMQASPLMDAPGFARRVESCYREMVKARP